MSASYPRRTLVLDDVQIAKKAGAAHQLDLFKALVDGRQGYDLLWSRAVLCPCRSNAQTEQPDPSCVYCRGEGWLYVHPHPELFPEECDAIGRMKREQGEHVRGLVQRMRVPRGEQKQAGSYLPGMGTLTVRPDVELGWRDRVIMVDAVMAFDQILTRNSDTVTIGRLVQTQMRYPIVKVLDVRTSTARFRERTHWTLTEAGELAWVTGQGPASGGLYTIRYQMHPRWIVTTFPRTIIGYRQPSKQTGLPQDTFTSLPQHCEITLDFQVQTELP